MIITSSLKITDLTAQKTKPHSKAESLILPACSEIVKIMFGDKTSNKI